MEEEEEGTNQGTRTEDSWTRKMGGLAVGVEGDWVRVINGEKGRATVTEQQ